MSVERHETGPRMSQVVVHGNTVYLAGVVARNNSGKSMTEQTKEVLSVHRRLSCQAGTDKSKLLSANIWVTDMAEFNEMNAVWDGWVSAGNTPARDRAGRSPPWLQGRDHGCGGEVTLRLLSRRRIARLDHRARFGIHRDAGMPRGHCLPQNRINHVSANSNVERPKQCAANILYDRKSTAARIWQQLV